MCHHWQDNTWDHTDTVRDYQGNVYDRVITLSGIRVIKNSYFKNGKPITEEHFYKSLRRLCAVVA